MTYRVVRIRSRGRRDAGGTRRRRQRRPARIRRKRRRKSRPSVGRGATRNPFPRYYSLQDPPPII